MIRLDGAVSFGNWKFDGDAKGNYQENEYNDEGQVIGLKTTPYSYALDGLWVGDMPQTSYVMDWLHLHQSKVLDYKVS